ncbi:phage portal protein [Jiangella asiatica]|uniref:Phage portal protein n=1 Tax=Jiangella asiatica TaxID=2530372 RepID=A0A4R5CY16_9ACTN|nr:phage portal protein [Jiangella asiatica]TDE02845.1 phage portal protein [Jiangella asiatica]
MAVPSTDLEWLTYLALRHDAEKPELEALDHYYEGTQPLAYMHPEIQREVGDRIKPLVLFWPQLVVDAVEERLDVEGFRLPDEDTADDDLWRVWQANDMDEQTQLGHVDALVMRRYFVVVGSNEADRDTPLVTAESPLEMFADIDPRTRKVRAALRRVLEQDDLARLGERYATLYLPNRTVWYEWGEGGQGWREVDRDEHNLGEVPVVPVVNRGRLSSRRDRHGRATRRLGTSELAPIIPLSDAANKIATDMMLTADAHAIPLRGFWGLSPEDLTDKDGNQLTAIQAMMRKFLTLPQPEGDGAQGKEFEFSAADLKNFHGTVELLARQASGMAGLPPNYFGLAADDAASADAIRSRETRLVKRCERKHRSFGGSYEESSRLVRRFQTGEWDPRLRQLETIWRDAGTPTVAQAADAATKKFQIGIVPLRQTREDLGYTDAQIRRMEEEDEKALQRDPVGVIARGMTGEPVPAERDGDAQPVA